MNWMFIHSYVAVNCRELQASNRFSYGPNDPERFTGNILVDLYESSQRRYSMIIFRPARVKDELSNPINKSYGKNRRGEQYPGPSTVLLVSTGEKLSRIRIWLSSRKDRFSNFTNEAASEFTSSEIINGRHSIPHQHHRNGHGSHFNPGHQSISEIPINYSRLPPNIRGVAQAQMPENFIDINGLSQIQTNRGRIVEAAALEFVSNSRPQYSQPSQIARRNSTDTIFTLLPRYEREEQPFNSPPSISQIPIDIPARPQNLINHESLESSQSSSVDGNLISQTESNLSRSIPNDFSPPDYWDVASATNFGKNWVQSNRNPSSQHQLNSVPEPSHTLDGSPISFPAFVETTSSNPQTLSQPNSLTLSQPNSQSLSQPNSQTLSQTLSHSNSQELSQTLSQSNSQELSQTNSLTLPQANSQPNSETLAQVNSEALPQFSSHVFNHEFTLGMPQPQAASSNVNHIISSVLQNSGTNTRGKGRTRIHLEPQLILDSLVPSSGNSSNFNSAFNSRRNSTEYEFNGRFIDGSNIEYQPDNNNSTPGSPNTSGKSRNPSNLLAPRVLIRQPTEDLNALENENKELNKGKSKGKGKFSAFEKQLNFSSFGIEGFGLFEKLKALSHQPRFFKSKRPSDLVQSLNPSRIQSAYNSDNEAIPETPLRHRYSTSEFLKKKKKMAGKNSLFSLSNNSSKNNLDFDEACADNTENDNLASCSNDTNSPYKSKSSNNDTTDRFSSDFINAQSINLENIPSSSKNAHHFVSFGESSIINIDNASEDFSQSNTTNINTNPTPSTVQLNTFSLTTTESENIGFSNKASEIQIPGSNSTISISDGSDNNCDVVESDNEAENINNIEISNDIENDIADSSTPYSTNFANSSFASGLNSSNTSPSSISNSIIFSSSDNSDYRLSVVPSKDGVYAFEDEPKISRVRIMIAKR
ncbi:hypothetical protein AYI69_g501 [Smittium culicis]|uniref:Uncharacterized protein n=1 Tax=Smittium culicis TaxID=133412 RepID=A0A1R1YSU7_9FUNG|nr:hypothetical protein AYI69_g501 [Smittium culicis]